jgi:hypothetical protein
LRRLGLLLAGVVGIVLGFRTLNDVPGASTLDWYQVVIALLVTPLLVVTILWLDPSGRRSLENKVWLLGPGQAWVWSWSAISLCVAIALGLGIGRIAARLSSAHIMVGWDVFPAAIGLSGALGLFIARKTFYVVRGET